MDPGAKQRRIRTRATGTGERGPGEAFVLPALAAGVDRAERGRRARRRPDKHHHDQAGQQPQPPSPHRTASPPRRPRERPRMLRPSFGGRYLDRPSDSHSAGHVAASFKSGEPEHLLALGSAGSESLMADSHERSPIGTSGVQHVGCSAV